MKNVGINNLAMAMKKRKEIQEHLDGLLKSVTGTVANIEKLQNENNLVIKTLTSMMEDIALKPVITEKDCKTKTFFSKLGLTVCDSDDTSDTLKNELNEAVELIQQNLVAATKVASEYERKKKIKMKLFLYEEGSRHSTFLEEGFVLTNMDGSDGLANLDPIIRSELFLIWHICFSIVRKRGFELPDPVAIVPPSLDCTPVRVLDSSLVFSSSMPTTMPRCPNFVPGQSIFIMKLSRFGVAKGEIHIHPSTTFYPEFVNALGDFCFKAPKVFCNGVEKVCCYNRLRFHLFYLNFFSAIHRPSLECLPCLVWPIRNSINIYQT